MYGVNVLCSMSHLLVLYLKKLHSWKLLSASVLGGHMVLILGSLAPQQTNILLLDKRTPEHTFFWVKTVIALVTKSWMSTVCLKTI